MIITEMSTLERLEDYEIRSEYGSETLKYDIAAALVAARKMRNLTQAALANIAGVSQAYIAKLESGDANPTLGRIGAILAAIWLKADINLMALVPILDTRITKQTKTAGEASVAAPSKLFSEIEQWVKRQMQHIEEHISKRGQSSKMTMESLAINIPYITLTQPAIVEGASGLATAIQPPIIAPENRINSSAIGAGVSPVRLVA